ncbi:MAG: hypothetical protein QNJ47_22850 [Nostocaceae cyanobacterium]|nr:hypothetical protein [Nostocaceae cyanobacterium]
MEVNDKSNSSSNTISTEAVIFIPGLSGEEKGYLFDILCEGLENQEWLDLKLIGEVNIPGHSSKRFGVYSQQTLLKQIDIYEAFWLDIIADQRLSNKDFRTKLLGGTDLLIYWLFSPVWKAFYEAPSLIIGLLLSLLTLVFWYYGILVTLIKEVGENNHVFEQVIPINWGENATFIGQILDGWSFFIFIGIILSILGSFSVDKLIDKAHFVKRYLGNVGGILLRNKIRSRLRKITDDVLYNYDKLTIVAHSFGAIIATDLLADYDSTKQVEYITLGASLKLLSYRSKWIKKEIKKCLDNQFISEWNDFYSMQDWLGGKTPISSVSNSAKIKFHEFPIQCSFIDRLLGITHIAYLSNPLWAKILLKDG